MTKLKDPNRNPWEIIEERTDKDGRKIYIRNDGHRLTDAKDNIWYKMMTVGESQKDHRRHWNGWACQNLSDDARAKLAKELKLDPNELGELTSSEQNNIKKRIASEEIPDISKFRNDINFYNCIFLSIFFAAKFYFPTSINFRGAQFSNSALFYRAQFSSWAGFKDAQFSRSADFQLAQFSGRADFDGAQFSERAHFQGAQFSQAAYFQGAQFSQAAYFNRTRFESETRFDKAHFKTFTPEFYGAEFHPNITLPTPENPTKNWPEIYQVKIDPEPMLFLKERQNPDYEKSRITSQKNAYTELRRQMHELHKVEEEQFFYRQEMACQRALEKPEPQETTLKTFQKWFEKIPTRVGYYLYDQISGYGWSILWPLLSLTAVWLSGAAFYVWKTIDFGSALLLSSASTIPAFGTRRELLGRLFKDEAVPYSIYWVSMLQTLFGFILIFVLLLAIRNRFRLR